MEFEDLRLLTALKYQKSIAGLSAILARETEIRRTLAKLKNDVRGMHAVPVDEPGIRNIGADLVWLRWVERTTQDLNIELAKVLARKEALLAGQRVALGRKTVAAELADKANSDKAAKHATRAMHTAIQSSLPGSKSNQ